MSESNSPSRYRIWQMFDKIAHRYDLLNRVLSLRRDVAWRKELGRHIPESVPLRILDIATGTADIPLMLASDKSTELIVGADRSLEMLKIGRVKVADKQKTGLYLMPADGMFLPFSENTFNVTTIAFGIRNMQDIDLALQEMYRVLALKGKALILEFALPANPIIRKAYLFYFRNLLPILGGMISGDIPAYRYLNQSVETFPYGTQFCQKMEQAGFVQVGFKAMTFGICCLYWGEKRENIG